MLNEPSELNLNSEDVDRVLNELSARTAEELSGQPLDIDTRRNRRRRRRRRRRKHCHNREYREISVIGDKMLDDDHQALNEPSAGTLSQQRSLNGR